MVFKLSRNVVASTVLRLTSFACVACLATLAVAGGELDSIYAGPPPYTESAPCQATFSWHDCARGCEPAVMLVGDPEHSIAAAVVISAKHRLLVTNAHVADGYYLHGTMTAMANGTTTTYNVDQVWYHPGVIRKHPHFLEIRCQDPSHGEVVAGCPDLAVLHLAEGPELPQEVRQGEKITFTNWY